MFQYNQGTLSKTVSAFTLFVSASLLAAQPAIGQTTTAADYSGNYANAGELITKNGGSGFAGPFTVTQGPTSSFYKYDSRLNGAGGNNTPSGVGINDASSRAIGLNSQSAGSVERVQRVLSVPLTVGSTFSFAFDNGYIDNGFQRMFLGTASSTNLVEFGFQGGTNAYEFNGTQAIGFGFTDGGLNVSFTLNTPTTYTMTAKKLNDNSTYTYNGTLASAASLNTISFQTTDSGHDQYHDFYFNNLAVVPASQLSQNAPEQARSADSFVDTIGVNAGQTTNMVANVGDLGIRHLRHGHLTKIDPTDNITIYNNYGTQILCTAEPYYASVPGNANYGQGLAQQITSSNGLSRYPAGSVSAVEGLNEPNFFANYTVWNGQSYEMGAAYFQNDFYPYVKSSAYRSIPIANYSVGDIGNNHSGPTMNSFDWENLHNYCGHDVPTTNLGRDIGYVNQQVGTGNPTKPIIITEFGWSTDNGGDSPVSRTAQLKYTLRQYAEYANAGIRRAYLYDLTDSSQTYNLVYPDGVTKKPTYYGLKNFINILKEAAWNSGTHQWSVLNFQPGWLNYSLTRGPVGVNFHHLLLQKSNGDFYLCLWNSASVTSGGSSNTLASDVNNPDAAVTLILGTSISSGGYYKLNTDGSFSTGGLNLSSGTISLGANGNPGVPDGMLILRLSPSGGLSATQSGPGFSVFQSAVNCAGPASGSFQADTGYYTWGSNSYTAFDGEAIAAVYGGLGSTGNAINTATAASPAPANVYQTDRVGSTTYNALGLTPGQSYKVRLHFSETYGNNAGGRKFDVQLNGVQVLNDFDVFAAAGGANRANIQEFLAFANSDGKIIITLLPHSADLPKINDIEILSTGYLGKPYSGTAPSVPAGGSLTLQCADFDKGGEGVSYHDRDSVNQSGQYRTLENVDIENCNEGGYDVNDCDGGEWLKYTVNAAAAGTYSLTLRYATAYPNQYLHIEDETGRNLTGSRLVNSTGGWRSFTNLSLGSFNLSAGKHVLKVVEDTGAYNLKSLTLTGP